MPCQVPRSRNPHRRKGWEACKTQPQAAAAEAAPSKQEQACLAAASDKANNGEVTVLSSEFSQANVAVMPLCSSMAITWEPSLNLASSRCAASALQASARVGAT
jgi:hypothetical protein